MVVKLRSIVFFVYGIALSLIPSRRGKLFDLIIVRDDMIGDYVLFMNSLKAYKKKYNGKNVLLICSDIVSSLASDDSFYSDITTLNIKKIKTSFKYYAKFLYVLKDIEADKVVYPIPQRHEIGDIIVANIKSNHKIGFFKTAHSFIGMILNMVYTEMVKIQNKSNEIDSIELFTQKTMDPLFHYQLERIRIPIAVDIMKELPSKYVVVAISSSWEPKIWPPEKFAQLINEIPIEYRVVLCGAGNSDIKRAQLIIDLVHNKKRLINMINKTSVKSMVTMIANATFIVGNDSAAIHIAAATHVPSMCLFHGAHFGRFLPYPKKIGYTKYHPRIVYYKMDCYNCDFRCKWSNAVPFPCLDKVSVPMAVEQLSKLLIELNKNEREN